jgi:hypothetical protein
MLGLVQAKRVSGSISFFSTLTTVLSTYKHIDITKELEQKLHNCRTLLQLQCNKLLRYTPAFIHV